MNPVKPDDGAPVPGFGGLKVSWATGTLIVVLSLAVWIYFWNEHLPLDAASTGVVVFAIAICVMVGKWLWSRLRRSASAK
jgi:hypothetical protein